MERIAFDDREIVLPPGYKHLARYLKKFAKNNPRRSSNVFLMMPFEESSHNRAVAKAIKLALNEYGLVGLRADEREYAPTLWDNVCTYVFGCKYGIAVFDKSKKEDFNPNVAIELGFALARNKMVFILKDKRITSLPSDIVGRLYHQFDPKHLGDSIKQQVRNRLRSLGLKKKDLFYSIFKALSPREKKVLKFWFGVGEKRRFKLKEIAYAFATSEHVVTRIRDTAISKMGGSRRVRELLEYVQH